ncbi:MAG: amidohydrolase family protein [Clostridia bacterium]|nr:amidohydrolase family protein [Clostridia bacterium]
MKTKISNVRVIDGSGKPAFLGDVGIDWNGRLQVLKPNSGVKAKDELDGTGLTVTPAFIDAHSHGDLVMSSEYATLSKLNQGIGTQIAGHCGVSLFPYLQGDGEEYLRFVSGIAPYPGLPKSAFALESYGSFRDWMESIGNPIDTRCFVGHGTLRLMAMGYANRRPDSTELERMKAALRRSMREGALGLSTGLVYAPCCYADNEEILALLRVVAEEGGFYATHPRNEADSVVEARRESLKLAKEAGVPLCVSHLKAAGRDNWGKPKVCLADIDAALEEGMKILIDCYPYTAGNTSLNVSIPPRYFKKGLKGLLDALDSPTEREIIRLEMERKSDYDNYIYNSGGFSGTYVSSCPFFHDAEGMFLTDYAKKVGLSPFDAYCDILIKNQGLGLGIYFHMSEDDLHTIFAHPRCAVSTDGLIGKEGDNPHPRSFGTMPRAFRFMTEERGICSREEAVHRMTGLPAGFFGLRNKGLVRDGYDADLLLIDEAAFADQASYANGDRLCSGIVMMFIKGKTVYKENRICS